jgi:hypothetical protein
MSETVPQHAPTDVVKNYVKPEIRRTPDGGVYIVETGNTKYGTIRDQSYGEHWQGKAWGKVGEFALKTGASLMGEGYLATGGKLILKSTGTAVAAIGDGYEVKDAFIKGTIVNTFTPSNLGHLYKHGKGGLVGHGLAEWSDLIKGKGDKGTTFFEKNGLTWNPGKTNITILGKSRELRPWTTEIGGVQVEMHTLGYGAYHLIKGNHGGGHENNHTEAAEEDLKTGEGHFPNIYVADKNDTRNPLEKMADERILYGKDANFIALYTQGFKDKAYEYQEALEQKSSFDHTIPQSIGIITLRHEISTGGEIVAQDLKDLQHFEYGIMTANEDWLRGINNGTIRLANDPLLNNVAAIGANVWGGANWLLAAGLGTVATAGGLIWNVGFGIADGFASIPYEVASAIYTVGGTEMFIKKVQACDLINKGLDAASKGINAVNKYTQQLDKSAYERPRYVWGIGDDGQPKQIRVDAKTRDEKLEQQLNDQVKKESDLLKLVRDDYRNKVNKSSPLPKNNNIVTDKKQVNALKQFIKSLPQNGKS